MGNEVGSSTQEQLQDQDKLAAMNRARLVTAFPEVAEAGSVGVANEHLHAKAGHSDGALPDLSVD